MRRRVAAVLLVTSTFAMGCGSDEPGGMNTTPKGTIHVRTMTVLTGATSENGLPHYQGIKDALREANETGGIRGWLIEEKTVNHSYMQAMWTAAYDDWKANDADFGKVIQFFSWGTPDTQQFSMEAATRQVPWISGSFSTTLATPLPQMRTVRMPDGMDRTFVAAGAPYNFFVGTDYSTQIRIAMDFVKKRGGTKVAFAYCGTSGFCTEPIPPGQTYAVSVGLQLRPDVKPGLGDTYEAVDMMVKTYAESLMPGDDTGLWFWVGNSIFSSTHFAKATKKYLPNAKIIMNLYGMDERTFALCGADCVDRVFSVQAFAAFGDTRHPGMEEVLRVYNKWRMKDGHSLDDAMLKNMRYVQGYVSFLLFRRGIEKLVDDKKELTGKNLKEAYESFRQLQTGGLTPPISYTGEDHRPTNRTRIYSMNAAGKLEYQDEISIPLQAEWLGW
jgi:branched-chain amino acid transport system substrate-binding protein